MAWRSAAHISILWLRLPLATNGVDVDMILGFDAVIGMKPETQHHTGIRAAGGPGLGKAARVPPDALDHGRQTIGPLRRQTTGQAQPPKGRLGVKRQDLCRGPA